MHCRHLHRDAIIRGPKRSRIVQSVDGRINVVCALLQERGLTLEASEMSTTEIGEDDVAVGVVWGVREDLGAFLDETDFLLFANGVSKNAG